MKKEEKNVTKKEEAKKVNAKKVEKEKKESIFKRIAKYFKGVGKKLIELNGLVAKN